MRTACAAPARARTSIPRCSQQAAEITKRFIHDHQEKIEEELVFTRSRRPAAWSSWWACLASQHAAGAKLTDKILAAAPQARNKEPREAMGRDVQALLAMYRPHMAREATDVFPTLRHLVTADEYAEIADEMDKARAPGCRRRWLREGRQAGGRGRAGDRHPGHRRVHAQELTVVDEDLERLSREALIAEVKRLRQGIREHRDSSGHDLCWHHPQLWGLLPERDRPRDRRAAVAQVPARLREVPRIARTPAARRAGLRSRVRR